jgi:hypothetical protein
MCVCGDGLLDRLAIASAPTGNLPRWFVSFPRSDR